MVRRQKCRVSCVTDASKLILALSWARHAGKGRGGIFLFLLFLHFHSISSFSPVPLFHLLYCPCYLSCPFLCFCCLHMLKDAFLHGKAHIIIGLFSSPVRSTRRAIVVTPVVHVCVCVCVCVCVFVCVCVCVCVPVPVTLC